MEKVYSNGTAVFAIAASSKLSVTSGNSPTKVYYEVQYESHPSRYVLLTTVAANASYTSSAFTAATNIRIEAGVDGAEYVTGANAAVVPDEKITRSTIANAGTVTVAQHQGKCLYQDASAGNVTMTSATATDLAAALPDMAIGDAIVQYLSSNHATNTSTIAGGTGVTLVGSGAVINTGGTFLLIKTAAATFDLVRVG